MQRLQDGLVFKAHILLYESILGLRVIKKKKSRAGRASHYQTLPRARERPVLLNGEDTVGFAGPCGRWTSDTERARETLVLLPTMWEPHAATCSDIVDPRPEREGF